ncbi:hypothetical protein RJ641_007076, partial [Dillenia turbinata]
MGRFPTPKDMAYSHLAMASDARYVYVVSGQYDPQCRKPIVKTFVLDTEPKKKKKKKKKMREHASITCTKSCRSCNCGEQSANSSDELTCTVFTGNATATQLWRGGLHVMGGSKENRHTPGLEHWGIAVNNGKALEKEWHDERITMALVQAVENREVTHKEATMTGPEACVVVNDWLFVIGGLEGDFMAKPGSAIFKCSRRHEWKVLAPMPKPNSHIEFVWVIVNNSIIIVGGTTEKHPVTKRMIPVGEVLRFHLDSLKWSVIGKLPYRVKITIAGFWKGWLYFTSGQQDRGLDNPQPQKVIADMFEDQIKL